MELTEAKVFEMLGRLYAVAESAQQQVSMLTLALEAEKAANAEDTGE